eukprot:7801363-Pyramimonas_sp.AAC.1
MAWRSHRLARKVPSSLAAETLGVDEGLANGNLPTQLVRSVGFPWPGRPGGVRGWQGVPADRGDRPQMPVRPPAQHLRWPE